jgi:hypothetical protein
MSPCTVQFVKPPAKIGTPGSAGMLAAARTPSTAEKPITAESPATAGLKGTAETLVTPVCRGGYVCCPTENSHHLKS